MPGVNRTDPLPHGERYPVIESVVSDFDVLLASLPEMVGRANALLERMARVFSDENLAGLSDTIRDLRAASASLPQTSQDVGKLVQELRATTAEIDAVAGSLRAMTEEARPQVRDTLGRLSQTATSLAQASARLDRFTQNSEAQLGNFSEQGLFELERLVRETRAEAREFRELSRSLKDNPSQILYEPPPSGIEIRP